MPQSFCPHLVTFDPNYNQGPAVDYPSFENRCLANGESEPLLFPQQATFCLSNGHALCPVYVAAQRSVAQRSATKRAASVGSTGVRSGEAKAAVSAAVGKPTGDWQPVRTPRNTTSAPADSNSPPIILAKPLLETEPETTEESWLNDRRRWGWIGAGVVFVAVLLLGGVVAAYVGWQFANTQLAVRLPLVSVAEQVATMPPAAPATTFIVWTATPEGGVVAVALPPANDNANHNNEAAREPIQATSTSFQFPVAVTATPGGQSANFVANPADDASDVIVVEPPSPQAVPVNQPSFVDVNVEIPTRRPTPFSDVNIDGNINRITSTLGISNSVPMAPANTATPAGTPVVIFGADAKILKPYGCTTVRWSVQNVKEVYYDNIGVNGTGEREECIRETIGEFVLKVILSNGALQVYTSTVAIDLPTATPLPTFTFTPEVLPSPTWTPEPPTLTPTPNVRRAVLLSVQGSSPHTCAINSACAIGLTTSNTGDQIDTLIVQKIGGDTWSPQLCRVDGVCGGQLTINSVSPGNTAYIELRLAIPVDASTGQSGAYQIVARSEGSGNTIMSETVTVTVLVQ